MTLALSSLLVEPEKVIFELLTAFSLLAPVKAVPARSRGGSAWWKRLTGHPEFLKAQE